MKTLETRRTRVSFAQITFGLLAVAGLLSPSTVTAKDRGNPDAEPVEASLLTASAGDLVAQSLEAAHGPALPGLSTDPVSMSWPIANDRGIDLSPPPMRTQSREYWRQVTAAELATGVQLDMVGSGSIVRINPVANEEQPLLVAPDPSRFEIIAPNGVSLGAGAATDSLVSAAQLAEAGIPFAEGTSAFRLRSDLGPGVYTLRVPELETAVMKKASGNFVVHVFEPQSDVVLELNTLRADHLHGDTLGVELELLQGRGNLPVSAIRAFVTSPAGRLLPLEFAAAQDGSFQARWIVDAREALAEGLWEVHAVVEGKVDGNLARRGARVAFAAALPTARLTGAASFSLGSSKAPSVETVFSVQAASASRYEVRGILFGTDAAGDLQPLAVGHTADWIEEGAGELTLSFGSEILSSTSLKAPFEIRDLRLVDQGRMALVHRQARGLVLQ